MAFRALVTVGSYPFPEPSAYSGNTATLVDSARNLEGVVIGSVIRDDVAKVEMSWRYLTVEQWAAINKCFKQSAGGKFYNTVTTAIPSLTSTNGSTKMPQVAHGIAQLIAQTNRRTVQVWYMQILSTQAVPVF